MFAVTGIYLVLAACLMLQSKMKFKSWQFLGIETRTLSLRCQYSTTQLRQPDNFIILCMYSGCVTEITCAVHIENCEGLVVDQLSLFSGMYT